ncbi:MAG: glycosyltransferase family 4 protein [Pseudomonadota bacterium]
MRVAYVSILDLGSRMAHGVQVMKNAQAWSKVFGDFEFITNVTPQSRLRLDPEAIARLYGLSHRFAIQAYPLASPHPRLTPYWPQKLFHRLAARRCARRGVDLVYTRANLTPAATIALGLPTVVETHSPPGDEPDKQALYAVLGHPLLKALVTISDDLARRYRAFGLPAEKILVAPDGVDMDLFAGDPGRDAVRRELGLSPTRPLAMYVGHLYDGRGVDEILHAAAELPDVDFALVGGHAADVERWRARAAALGLMNLRLMGFVPNTQVPRYLWAGDVLLMPYSTACPTAAWMSPLKMFEYMAAGRPILASDLPAIRAILSHGQTAHLAPPDSGPALAAGVRALLADPARAAHLAAAAKAESARYSWDQRVADIMAFVGVRP